MFRFGHAVAVWRIGQTELFSVVALVMRTLSVFVGDARILQTYRLAAKLAAVGCLIFVHVF